MLNSIVFKRLIAGLCIGLVSMTVVHARMSKELDVREELDSAGGLLFFNDDFNIRDEVIEDVLKGATETPGGSPKLTLLSIGVGSYFNRAFIGKKGVQLQSEYARLEEQVDDWIKERPKQTLPVIAKAQMMIAYAGHLRGGGAANTVDSAVWPVYEAELAKAKNWLLENQNIAKTTPLWYVQMILLARLQSDSEAKWKWLEEGAKQYPEYRDIYTTSTEGALPRWGGSAAEVERVATSAQKYASADFANMVYATVWFDALSREPSLAKQVAKGEIGDWQLMKRGWEYRIKRYPDNWPRNGYAAIACLVGDQATYKKQIEQVGADIIPQVWPKAVSYEQCQKQ